MKVPARYAWASRPEGRVFNNLTIPASPAGIRTLEQIDGAQLMRAAHRAGGKVAFFDAKWQGEAFHPSAVVDHHPGLHGRDLVTEMVRAGERLGVGFGAYVPVHSDSRAWRTHPEWRPLRPDGAEWPTNGFPNLCPQSPFADHLVGYLRELVSTYPVAGLYLDGIGFLPAPPHGRCHCRWCQESFQRATGLKLPMDATETVAWEALRRWKPAQDKAFLAHLVAEVHALAPGLPILVNCGWGGWRYGTVTISELDIQVSHEASWFWQTASVQYLRAAAGGDRPVDMYMPSFQYSPSYRLAVPRHELRLRAMNAIANGAMPTFTLTALPADLAAVSDELAARAPWLDRCRPLPWCSVAFSERSTNRTDTSTWGEPPHFSFYGALRMLQEEHLPQRTLSDCGLDAGSFADDAVLVLPPTGVVPSALAARLDAWVRAGGALVAQGACGTVAEDGSPLPAGTLEGLLGVRITGELQPEAELEPWLVDPASGAELPNRVRHRQIAWERHPLIRAAGLDGVPMVEVVPAFTRGHPATPHLPWTLVMSQAEARPGTRVLAWDLAGRHPFLTVRRHGRGRVVWCAGDLGRHYCSRVTWTWVRQLFTSAVRWAATRPQPLMVEAPTQVAATSFVRDGALVVHLLNDPNPRGYPPFTKQEHQGEWASVERQRDPAAPVAGVRVSAAGRWKRAFAVPGRRRLPLRHDRGHTTVILPVLDTHAMVVFEP